MVASAVAAEWHHPHGLCFKDTEPGLRTFWEPQTGRCHRRFDDTVPRRMSSGPVVSCARVIRRASSGTSSGQALRWFGRICNYIRAVIHAPGLSCVGLP